MSSSWLRTNVAHCAVAREVGGRASSASAERPGVARASGEVEVLHADEVEEHRELVAVLVAEEPPLLGVRQVHLAEQDGVAAAAAEERAEVAEVRVRVGQRSCRPSMAGRLDEERDGVDPEAGDAELEPEAHDLGDLVADRRVGDVEVGLVLVEAVEVVLAGLLVPLPEAGLLVGEGDVAWSCVFGGSSLHTYQSR